MLKMKEIEKLKNCAITIEENKTEITEFVNIALSQFTLAKSSEITGLHITKISRALNGKGFSDSDLMKCFLAISKRMI